MTLIQTENSLLTNVLTAFEVEHVRWIFAVSNKAGRLLQILREVFQNDGMRSPPRQVIDKLTYLVLLEHFFQVVVSQVLLEINDLRL